jgi:hypothetical protein
MARYSLSLMSRGTLRLEKNSLGTHIVLYALLIWVSMSVVLEAGGDYGA